MVTQTARGLLLRLITMEEIIKHNNMPHTYTPKDIAYIKAHYKQGKTAQQVADHIGTTAQSVKMWVYNERQAGRNPVPKFTEVGTIVDRKRSDGSLFQLIRTADGWRYLKTGTRPVKHKQPVKPQKQMLPAIPTAPRQIVAKSKARTPKQRKGAVVRTGQKVRTVFSVDSNPETVKIKSDAWKIEEGWRFVDIGKRAKALRPPHKLSA